MDNQTLQLLNEVDRAIIKFRRVYSVRSKKHGIGYNEMLVLYTMRDLGYCSQKQICDSYLVPKQTINHVMSNMLDNGILCISPENCAGREKAYVFTDMGWEYARPLLDSLGKIEAKAVKAMGAEKIRQMTALACEYDNVLNSALAEVE